MRTYLEFCLFNTWVVMKLVMFITPKSWAHPWKTINQLLFEDPMKNKSHPKHSTYYKAKKANERKAFPSTKLRRRRKSRLKEGEKPKITNINIPLSITIFIPEIVNHRGVKRYSNYLIEKKHRLQFPIVIKSRGKGLIVTSGEWNQILEHPKNEKIKNTLEKLR